MSDVEDYDPALPPTEALLRRMKGDIEGLKQNNAGGQRPELATAQGYIENYVPNVEAIIQQMEAGRIKKS